MNAIKQSHIEDLETALGNEFITQEQYELVLKLIQDNPESFEEAQEVLDSYDMSWDDYDWDITEGHCDEWILMDFNFQELESYIKDLPEILETQIKESNI